MYALHMSQFRLHMSYLHLNTPHNVGHSDCPPLLLQFCCSCTLPYPLVKKQLPISAKG